MPPSRIVSSRRAQRVRLEAPDDASRHACARGLTTAIAMVVFPGAGGFLPEIARRVPCGAPRSTARRRLQIDTTSHNRPEIFDAIAECHHLDFRQKYRRTDSQRREKRMTAMNMATTIRREKPGRQPVGLMTRYPR